MLRVARITDWKNNSKLRYAHNSGNRNVSSANNPGKIYGASQGLKPITHGLCISATVLYQLSYEDPYTEKKGNPSCPKCGGWCVFRFWFVFIKPRSRSKCFSLCPLPSLCRPRFSFHAAVPLVNLRTTKKKHTIKNRQLRRPRVERMMLWLLVQMYFYRACGPD